MKIVQALEDSGILLKGVTKTIKNEAKEPKGGFLSILLGILLVCLVTYSFGVEHVPKEIKIFIGPKNIKTNIFRIQADNSIMCGYFCIGFIDFMFAGKSLIDFTSLFSPYDFKKTDKIILNYFK